jgi:hypothetical protein
MKMKRMKTNWIAYPLVLTGLTLTFYNAPGMPMGAVSRQAPDSIVAQVTTTNTSISARGEVLGTALAQPLTVRPVSAADHKPSEQVLAQGAAQSEKQAGLAFDVTIPPSLPPGLTYSFDTGTSADTRINIGGSPADANVAASHTHICVTARAAFAC